MMSTETENNGNNISLNGTTPHKLVLEDDEDEPGGGYRNLTLLGLQNELAGMDEATRNCIKNSEITEDSDDDSTSMSSSSSSLKKSRLFPNDGSLDDFILNALLAIRTSVLEAAKDNKKNYKAEDDFMSSRKYKISMSGDKKLEVKDFAPIVFRKIRYMFGIDTKAYLMSWSDSRLERAKSSGKSSSHFVPSPDRKFILKTLTRGEAKRLRKLLRSYYMHLESHPDTLLSRIFGLHRICKWRSQTKMYFAIINNVFDCNDTIQAIFDLKGSTVGRKAGEGSNVMKDLDFNRVLHLSEEMRQNLRSQAEADCKFLSGNHLMDYSLLIGIRHVDKHAITRTPSAMSTISAGTEKLPGLLFFIESAKVLHVPNEPKDKKLTRRKSLSMVPPVFTTPAELQDDYEEPKNEEKVNDTSSPDTENGHSEPTNEENEPSNEETDTPEGVDPVEEEACRDKKTENASNLRKSVHSHSTDESISASTDSLSPSTHMMTSVSVPDLTQIDNKSKPTFGSSLCLARLDLENAGDMRQYVPFFQRDDGGLQSQKLQEGDKIYYEIYHVGVIDFLQKYDAKKKLANFAKSLKYEKEGLSTVDPTFYMKRFMKMVQKVVGS